ncbi:S66 family peptidase [Enterococcus faecium]
MIDRLLRPLKRGDKIGFFSPSFPGSQRYPKRFLRAYNLLNQEFEVVPGFLSKSKENTREYVSGTRFQRAQEINMLVEQCDCLISTIGGYNSNSILELIDYKKIESKKPIVIGYSDSCAVSLVINAITGIPTFVSQAVIPNFGEFPPFSLENYRFFLKSLVDVPPGEYQLEFSKFWTDEWINWENFKHEKVKKTNKWLFLNSGRVKGKLVGGNLDTMCSLLSTRFMPIIDTNTILLIEETSIDISQIERNLYTLKLHGVFDKIKGLIISKFENIDYLNSEKTELKIINEILGERRIPILSNFDNGHTHPSTLLPIGGYVTIDCNKKQFFIDFDSVFRRDSSA